MERRTGSVNNPHHIAKLGRIEMSAMHVHVKIVPVADRMFPAGPLPDTAFPTQALRR